MLAKMWRNRNTPPLLVGLQAGTTTVENRQLNIILPQDPAIPLLGIYTEDYPTCNKNMLMFIAVLFIIVRN